MQKVKVKGHLVQKWIEATCMWFSTHTTTAAAAVELKVSYSNEKLNGTVVL